MANHYAAFYAAYSESVKAGSPLSKEEVVSDFTQGRTTSLKELSGQELEAIVVRLNEFSRFKPKAQAKQTENPKGDSMRKSIIAIFYKMNKTPAQAKDWAEKQGVRGIKRSFNDYTNSELFTLIRVAEKVLFDWQSSIRKKMTEL